MPLAVVACSVCHSIRLFCRGHEHVTEVAWDRLLTGLDVGDVDRGSLGFRSGKPQHTPDLGEVQHLDVDRQVGPPRGPRPGLPATLGTRPFWAIGGTPAGGDVGGGHTRGVQRVRAAVATSVRCRGGPSAARAVWHGVCRNSVGTVADASAPAGPAGRLCTKWLDVSAAHGRVSTRRHHLDEIRVSYGSEGWGFESLRARLQKWPRPVFSDR